MSSLLLGKERQKYLTSARAAGLACGSHQGCRSSVKFIISENLFAKAQFWKKKNKVSAFLVRNLAEITGVSNTKVFLEPETGACRWGQFG